MICCAIEVFLLLAVFELDFGIGKENVLTLVKMKKKTKNREKVMFVGC